MGVFDEVFHVCPRCGEEGYAQTKALDFPSLRTLRVDLPESLVEDLSVSDLYNLRAALSEEWFWFVCGGGPGSWNSELKKEVRPKGCGLVFNPWRNTEESLDLARELFKKPEEE